MGPVYWLNTAFDSIQVVQGFVEKEPRDQVGYMATPMGKTESYKINWYYVTSNQAVEAATEYCRYPVQRWTEKLEEFQQ